MKIKKNNAKKSARGFTLIEILIVVAIIGILASIVLVGIGPVQRQGRDTRRISDLKQVETALTLYYNRCGFYPGQENCGAAGGGWSKPSTWADLESVLTGTTGIKKIPHDPTSSKNYTYGSTDGSGYVLRAELDDSNNPILDEDVDGTVEGVDCADPYYCVQSY